MTKEIKENLTFHRYYFITYLMTDKITEDEGLNILEQVFAKHKHLCELLEIKKCGIKNLNYPIKKQDHAIYYTMIIKVIEDNGLKIVMNEINRIIKAEETIIRFLIRRSQSPAMPILQDTLPHLKAYFDKFVEAAKMNR